MKTVHHIVRISRRSYPVIRQFLDSQQLTPAPGIKLQHDKFAGLLYQPADGLLAYQMPIDAGRIHLSYQSIEAELHRLPSAELLALLGQVGVFNNQSLNATSLALRTAANADAAQQILHASPRSIGSEVQLLYPSRFTAHWQPQRTLIAGRCNEWFLVLFFDLSVNNPTPMAQHTDIVAIDIGLSPLLNACYARQNQDFRLINPIPPHLSQLARTLQGPQQQLLRQILYAWFRAELERFLDLLTLTAKQVYVEEIAYPNLNKSFLADARIYGLIDFHESWLHQRLQVCGIPYERVWPNGTSQRCHICPAHPYGVRSGSAFYCPNCGSTLDAHANAARNIARRGDKKRELLQQQARYGKSLQLRLVSPTGGQATQ